MSGPKAVQEQRGDRFIDENGTPMGRKGRQMNGHGPKFIDENGDVIRMMGRKQRSMHGQKKGGGHHNR
ncbi:MAG: hypothetical protein ACE5I1_14675 [bacterium]